MSLPVSWGAHVARRGTLAVQLSFESGQQNTARVHFQDRVRITGVRGEVTKALAATDAGTITPKDAAGATMTNGVLTFAAAAALNNRQSATPTANQVVAAGSFLDLVAAKTTAGGAVQCYIDWEIFPGP